MIFSLIFFLCAFIPPFVSNFDDIRSSGIIRFLKSPEFFTPLTSIFLALALFSFGVFRYVVSLDDSNPNHLETICSKYDDSTRWLVQGKVIEEPNFKAGHLEVLVKPDKIARYETEESEDTQESQESQESSGTQDSAASDEGKAGKTQHDAADGKQDTGADLTGSTEQKIENCTGHPQ